MRDSNGAPRHSALRRHRKKEEEVKKAAKKTATLIVQKTTASKDSKGSKKRAGAPDGKKLAIAIARAPKRTPATIEFLRREAAKLTSAASDPAEQTAFLTDHAAASAKRQHCDTFLAEPTTKKHRRLAYDRPSKETRGKGVLRGLNRDIEALISSSG